jgi:DNA invertase Pin-like site-specific DNA recombinase
VPKQLRFDKRSAGMRGKKPSEPSTIAKALGIGRASVYRVLEAISSSAEGR